jgi:hypothetical protein
LYYGDEIAMPGGRDPDNRHDFPGGWPSDPKNAFTAEGRTPEQQDVFTYVQTLLRLRHEHPALQGGRGCGTSSLTIRRMFFCARLKRNAFLWPSTIRLNHGDQYSSPRHAGTGCGWLYGGSGSSEWTLAGNEARVAMPAKSISIFLVE